MNSAHLQHIEEAWNDHVSLDVTLDVPYMRKKMSSELGEEVGLGFTNPG